MRLTQKTDKEHEYLKMCIGWYELPTKNYHVRIINETPSQMYQKLGQLEDIEEEFGINLITLFKALKNGIAIKDEPLQNYPCSLNHNDIGWLLFVRTDGVLGAYYLQDYSKTWALTKEELL